MPGPSVLLQWDGVAGASYMACVADAPIVTACPGGWRVAATPSLTWDALAPGLHYWQVRVLVPAGRFDLNGSSWPFTVSPPADHWTADYFANMTLTGPPASTVDEGTGFVDHSWGTGGPAGLPVDNFSARFTRTVTFPAGRYRFTVMTDDGSRLWVDNQLTIDAWWDQGPTTYTADVDLTAGAHTLKYEYYEHTGGATAQLTWDLAPTPWHAQYFANRTLSGAPASEADEGTGFIDHDWGYSSPPGTGQDDFSSRWTRTVAFAAGTYRFTMQTDDGGRLFVDDELKLDKWYDHGPDVFTVDVVLSAGSHVLRFEQYEAGWTALARLSWALAPADHPEGAVAQGLAQSWAGPGRGWMVSATRGMSREPSVLEVAGTPARRPCPTPPPATTSPGRG